jgi:predicted DNA-binding protein (UPF0251 family)
MTVSWPRPPGFGPFESPDRPEHEAELQAAEAWRSWLVSGSRIGTADSRRLRGAHRGLKKMLVEGVASSAEHPASWRHFSGAMVRLAINDAVNSLPSDQTRIVWLAYFGGKSNREIAKQLGISVGAVQRRLRVALAKVAEQIERGRKTAYGLILFLAGHRLGQPSSSGSWWGPAIRAIGIFTAGAAAAATIAVQAPPSAPQAPTAPAAHAVQGPSAPAAGQSRGAAPPPAQSTVTVPGVTQVTVPAPPTELPVIPVPVPAPVLPRLPKLPIR